MDRSISDKAAIVGLGFTDYFRRGQSVPLTPTELAGNAITAAAKDAGLRIRDLDGFALYAGGLNTAILAQSIGMPEVRFTATLPGGGGGSAGALGLAAAAVTSGMAEAVITVLVLQQAGYRLGQAGGTGSPYAKDATAETDFSIPFGVVSPAHKFAMAFQRHMHLYGTTREHCAEIAISTRANAIRRSTSIMKEDLTKDQYFASRMISDPFCLFDYCLESDGAVAVITTSAERARDLDKPPVYIHAAAIGGEGLHSPPTAWANSPDTYLASGASRQVGQRLFEGSDFRPEDIDVAQIYDHFAPMVLLQLEDYGFCGRGEAGDFVNDGRIRWPNGALPVNTHGGHLSEAYLMGMTHIREAVEQLRGTATNQVVGADTVLVTGGPASIPMSAVILRR